MRAFIAIAFLMLSPVITGQTENLLKARMWNYIDQCYTMIKDGDIDGNLKPEVTFDKVNGYLKIAGDWPTCGCGCTSIVGAFKKADSSYVFLNTDYWDCKHRYSIRSNVDLFSIMPVGFGLPTFLDTAGIDNSNKYGVFYLKAEIPRYGTKTRITLELVPIGLLVECPDNICLSIEELSVNKNPYFNVRNIFYLQEFARAVSDVNSLMSIMYRDLNKIDESSRKAINSQIEGKSFDAKLQKVSKDLWFVYFRFKMYERLKYKSLLLEWDVNDSMFKIINREKAPAKGNFIEFIISSEFWQPIC